MPTDPRASRSFRRASLLCAAAIVPLAHGAIWESPQWALSSTLTGIIGYDSNLTLSRDGPEDMFVQARPQFTFSRRNSITDLHADAIVTGTKFFNDRQPDQTDVLISANYAYPFVDNTIPLYQSKVSWQRSSEPNQYLGRRVRHDRAALSGEAHMPLTGKLGLRGEADAYNDDFDDRTLNRNSRWKAFAGLVFERRPGLKFSVDAGLGGGRSRPHDATFQAVKGREAYLTGRIRGEITPKITGNMYAGYGHVKYTGGYSDSYDLPVAGVDLTWGIDPRRTVVLAVYSGADYAPDGQAIDTTRAFLSFTHVIVGRWQYIVRGGPTHTKFRRDVNQGSDTSWGGGVEFSYNPSDRFRVALGTFAERQRSDARDREYERATISLESSYRF